MIQHTGNARRGSVLWVVMAMVGFLAVIVGLSASAGSATRRAAATHADQLVVRSIAWSGVRAVQAELAAQRLDLLAGREPRLTESWRLFEDGGIVGAFRLIALRDSEYAIAEAAKANVNTASPGIVESILGSTGGRLIAARDRALIGSLDDIIMKAGPDDRRVADFLTGWTSDPEVESGVGSGSVVGRRRVPLADLRGERVATVMRSLLAGSAAERVIAEFSRSPPTSRRELVALLRRSSVEPAAWGVVLDRIGTAPAGFAAGRIDVNRAPAEVLAGIPGIGPDRAAAIVATRSAVDAESLKSIAWPVVEGVLDPGQFERAVDLLTTRSMQWRVRVQAGLIAREGADVPDATAAMQAAIIMDCVVDVAHPVPRLAVLSDRTGEPARDALIAELSGLRGEETQIAEMPRAEATQAQASESAGASPGAARAGGSAARRSDPARMGRWTVKDTRGDER